MRSPGLDDGFWRIWIYLAISAGACATIATYLGRSDPELLRRRTRGLSAEKDASQKIVQLAAVAVLAGLSVLLWLDRRNSWSHVPAPVSLAGDCAAAAGFLVIFRALRENTFAAVNIVVEAGQTVISTGPYAAVRHPYYAGLLLVTLATPLALGSWWGLLAAVALAAVLAWRIRYEERFLAEHLAGYADYCKRVRYRLIPAVW